jgi:hypothetical protein
LVNIVIIAVIAEQEQLLAIMLVIAVVITHILSSVSPG